METPLRTRPKKASLEKPGDAPARTTKIISSEQPETSAKRRGQIVRRADASPATICQTWALLLELNEAPEHREDDPTLLARMQSLYPGRTTPWNITAIRSAYNRGALPGQPRPPATPSRRYAKLGGRPCVLSPRGRVLSFLPQEGGAPHA